MAAHLHFSLIPLAEVQPGMVLSDDLIDHQGQVMLAKGTKLSDGTLASLARHGVNSLPIEAPPLSPEELAARRAHEAERIEIVFRKLDTDSPGSARILRELVTAYRMGG